MTKTIKVPDLTYTIDGDIVDIEQSIECGETTTIELHKAHIKMIAEAMRITEPSPANMSEIVKLELMELLDAIGEHWEENGRYKHLELELLTQAKALYQKALSVCRIAGCDVEGYRNDGSVDDELPTQCKDALNAINTQPSLLDV